ncbi:hypothetical protein M4914_10440 [Streptomyces somaliensis DSM 40738]|uniref:Uncharacterized protein n=1 Tax=Streptomyces somaliensis (strain ATCC 33201 / DSM 40738 / JCM 12659 / KCTC 9044 / NCTC 11332 / NRRL B-12077 / IP 733) TaxID=1134445 RepID=A0AA44ID26_STRE0|nr:hypothetical protein [Streptomyces somaliensis]MCQ0023322.1 hypothetical protein [Streptomyces somaliensis DSM 40738]NKY14047.1 hypothetical protein [Streptomyces somaliensis DSM 40738]
MADSPKTRFEYDAPVETIHLPLLGACGCGSGCSCGCQSGGSCSCSGNCG